MYKPALLEHVAAFPFGVFDRLHHPHKGDVVTGGRTAGITSNKSLAHSSETLHIDTVKYNVFVQ